MKLSVKEFTKLAQIIVGTDLEVSLIKDGKTPLYFELEAGKGHYITDCDMDRLITVLNGLRYDCYNHSNNLVYYYQVYAI